MGFGNDLLSFWCDLLGDLFDSLLDDLFVGNNSLLVDDLNMDDNLLGNSDLSFKVFDDSGWFLGFDGNFNGLLGGFSFDDSFFDSNLSFDNSFVGFGDDLFGFWCDLLHDLLHNLLGNLFVGNNSLLVDDPNMDDNLLGNSDLSFKVFDDGGWFLGFDGNFNGLLGGFSFDDSFFDSNLS